MYDPLIQDAGCGHEAVQDAGHGHSHGHAHEHGDGADSAQCDAPAPKKVCARIYVCVCVVCVWRMSVIGEGMCAAVCVFTHLHTCVSTSRCASAFLLHVVGTLSIYICCRYIV